MTELTSDFFTIDKNGMIHFTPEGETEYRSYFEYAGIDFDSIKTKQDYLEARRIASPYLFPWMEKEAMTLPDTLERKWLLSCITRGRSQEEHEALVKKVKKKNKLGIKRVK